MEKKELELRMYFFVPYNLSPIQQAIQAGHAAVEYARCYGHTDLFKNFADKWKTWVILNGGTTNESEKPERMGTMQQILTEIVRGEYYPRVDFAVFQEPDLNDALTAVCFICDERVFNKEDYPDFTEYLVRINTGNVSTQRIVELRMTSYEELKITYSGFHEKWLELIGGQKNLFLRELLKDKYLA